MRWRRVWLIFVLTARQGCWFRTPRRPTTLNPARPPVSQGGEIHVWYWNERSEYSHHIISIIYQGQNNYIHASRMRWYWNKTCWCRLFLFAPHSSCCAEFWDMNKYWRRSHWLSCTETVTKKRLKNLNKCRVIKCNHRGQGCSFYQTPALDQNVDCHCLSESTRVGRSLLKLPLASGENIQVSCIRRREHPTQSQCQ